MWLKLKDHIDKDQVIRHSDMAGNLPVEVPVELVKFMNAVFGMVDSVFTRITYHFLDCIRVCVSISVNVRILNMAVASWTSDPQQLTLYNVAAAVLFLYNWIYLGGYTLRTILMHYMG